MTSIVGNLQLLIVVVLSVVAFGLEVYALVDAVRHRPESFVAAEKRTKGFWVAILAVATAFGFIALPSPIGAGFISSLGFLSLIGVVAAAVYLTDVRPAVQQMRGRGGNGRSGPYGPY
ncbi:DUF2516 family protein [Kineosporia sp. A_224]|jgi:hypothetical protein|uniref:DUF2516 family protein n=1 Tax=Kineosporia sp. A_224 TaxID=1962180 RepID=UPI000B4BB6CE|nr:DUF2516 family protein [Kineosporia sp. A_224]